jgi:L-alanine-DL-glutamate epimerase-like enolase superfamily enzyme
VRRRSLIAAALALPLAACARARRRAAPGAQAPLLGFADDPIESFDFTASVSSPLLLESIELWWISDNEHVMFARIAGGLEVVLPTNKRFGDDLALFFGRVLPFFLGEDLRRIEALQHRCLGANYKIVGLPLWNAIGHLELLALEAIGQAARRSISDLLGGARRREVAVYLSSRERSTTAEQEIDAFMAPRVAATGARAIKLGIGGRMSRNADAAPGRSEALVARARRAFGDDFAICVDANGSYDAAAAVEVGRMLERYGVWFFEEPCPFEEFDMTRQVTEALTLPIAGGEQDGSLAKWRWMIEQRMVDIVQPDLFYAGGLLRSLRVARWAEARGLEVVPHAPRAHAGAATLLQYVALLDRPGRFHEFSAAAALAHSRYDYEPLLAPRQGRIAIPDRPGFGLEFDRAGIRRIGRRVEVELAPRPADD